MGDFEKVDNEALHSLVVERESNEITRAHEKLGGRLRPDWQMQEYKDMLDECGFQDLGFEGGKFTWCNGHREGHTVWERLDRVLATVD